MTARSGPSNQDALARGLLHELFAAAVARADPMRCLAACLPERPVGRCVVVGAGKAAASMAAALEAAWPDVPMSGLVTTRHGHAVPTRSIEVIEAGHPVPDAASERAARRILDLVSGLEATDLVLALISGGGSATMALPVRGISLRDKQETTRLLLRCGATIEEMNLVRQSLSAIKGGRLALAAAPARMVTLAVSDVPGDAPAIIASGPTVGVPPRKEVALRILQRYRLQVPEAVRQYLEGQEDAVARAGTGATDFRLITTPRAALLAAAERARESGFAPCILGDALEGESATLGLVMAGIARSVAESATPVAPPALLISGGETTVSLAAAPAAAGGRGGRNTEFLLSLAVALRGNPRVWALAADSDGIDGDSDAAGAVIAPDSLNRAVAAGLDPQALLARHDSYQFFDALGDLLKPGPTFTNVNDLRFVLIV